MIQKVMVKYPGAVMATKCIFGIIVGGSIGHLIARPLSKLLAAAIECVDEARVKVRNATAQLDPVHEANKRELEALIARTNALFEARSQRS